MFRLLSSAALALSLLSAVSASSFAQQNTAAKGHSATMDPDLCGAGGRGCASDIEKAWMAHAGEITSLPSVYLTIYASTCAARPDLFDVCLHDPYLILDYAGIDFH
ncbi:MAG: hypothetical protein M9924_21300 [Rhizobiaceae bacterium]|nr:hypothetical protein [Rhizobiaceae bacterium]